jgi:hypothetical protein
MGEYATGHVPSPADRVQPRDPERLRVGFLTGSGHTGSTLLALFMDTHPQIVSVGETAIKPGLRSGSEQLHRCSCGHPISECRFWQTVFEAVGRTGHELNASNWSNDYRYESRILHLMLSRYSSIRPARALQDIAGGLLPFHRARVRRTNEVNVAFIRSVLQIAGADVFFDTSKAPMRLWHLLRVPELDVRVVLLVRDVRGFCSSAKRRGQSVKEAASAWNNRHRVLADIAARLPDERVTWLRYEDLCVDPSRRLKELQRFLQVDEQEPPEFILSRDHHVLGNRIRRDGAIRIRPADDWSKTLTASEASEALRIAGQTNERFHYSRA